MAVFRRSTLQDVDAMVQIANEGKAILKARGVSQWQRGTYPSKELFIQDVQDGIGYVIEDEGEVVACMAVTFTDEESYRYLKSGHWLTKDDCVYATIHRSAVSKAHQRKGYSQFLFQEVEKFARDNHAISVRIDTHPDNLVMQHALEKYGFIKCCSFDILDGDEAGDLRFGYEKEM